VAKHVLLCPLFFKTLINVVLGEIEIF